MNFSASSNPVLYVGLLLGCLLLGAGLLALAWRRPRRRQRGLRMLAGALAAASLWLSAAPPIRHLAATPAEAIVLTPGYSPDSLHRLLSALGPGTAVWTYDSATTAAFARPLPSLLTLAEHRPALQRVHVLGRGLEPADLPQLGHISILPHQDAGFSGFEIAYWPGRLALGEVLTIEGTVSLGAAPGPDGVTGVKGSAGKRITPSESEPGAATWVVLQAAGLGRDSVRLPGSGGPFHLHYQPKTAGLACFELLLRHQGQPTQREPMPVEVIIPTRPAVLLLAATPSFEFKYLKNHLGEAHYPVALRTSVSRGLVQTDFLNQPAQSLDHLSPALLARYRLVVADAATLAALTAVETRALQAAIRLGRLGLVVLAEAAPLPRATPARADFVVRPRPAPTVPRLLRWPGAPGAARSPLPAQLLATAALRPLITGPAGGLLAARRRMGLGFCVVSTVPETFRWGLLGQPAIYASYWHQLLTAASPSVPAAATWHPDTRWPRPGQPLLLHLAGALPTLPPTVAPLAGGPAAHLALRQDSRLPEWSTAQYWPAAPGWYRVLGPEKAVFHFYVYPARAWASPGQQERWLAVVHHNQLSALVSPASTAARTVAEPWPAAWFFALFLLATSYLWLEEKL